MFFRDIYHGFQGYFQKMGCEIKQPFDNLRDMQRDVYQRLLDWKQQPKRKPLLVKGACNSIS
jgi:hypothetical protein